LQEEVWCELLLLYKERALQKNARKIKNTLEKERKGMQEKEKKEPKPHQPTDNTDGQAMTMMQVGKQLLITF
jgi:hypothetical protein